MSGILDNKSRILDTILTLEGRKQLASGKLVIEYASFSDAITFYSKDLASGSAVVSNRIVFESCHLPQDQITLESDDSGLLMPFKNGENITVKNGKIVTYPDKSNSNVILSGSVNNLTILSGTAFSSTSDALIASSFDNFTKLFSLGTKNQIFDDNDFGLSESNIRFTISDTSPIKDPEKNITNINNAEGLFQDQKLSKLNNFSYLPPINKLDDDSIDKSDYRNTKNYRLGDYRPWGSTTKLTHLDVENEIKNYDSLGCSKNIFIDPTSNKNNLFCQFFEVSDGSMSKLDIIDFGQYQWNNSRKHAFFVGKIFIDDNNCQTFVHLFTLVFG